MDQANPSAEVAELRAEQARGFRLLRFKPELEQRFREEYRESGRGFRLAMLCLACLMVLGIPLYNEVAGAPPDLRAVVMPILYWVQVPALLLALVVTLSSAWQQFLDLALVTAALALAAGFLAQRALATVYGFDIPLEFVGVLIVAVFFIARLRFRVFLPAALLMTALLLFSEVFVVSPEPQGWYRLAATLLLIVVALVGGYAQEYSVRAAWLERCVLRHLSMHDSLTGVLNRRAVLAAIDRGFRQAARDGVSYGVAVIDLDFFKAYNDAHGHALGDELLRRLAGLLRDAARRPHDCVGRLGGEEFVLAWYDANPREMLRRTEQLRHELAAFGFLNPRSNDNGVATMTIGLVTLRPTRHTSPTAVIDAADCLLYRAKRAGRNRVLAEHRD